MGRVPDIKRLRQEDFPAEQRELVGKLAWSFNTFADQVINLFNKNVDFTNLNQEIKEVDVRIDAGGSVINSPQIRTGLNTKVQGIICIQATNLNNPTTYPTNQPFISFDINGNILTILNISGLQVSSEYRLRLLLIGQ